MKMKRLSRRTLIITAASFFVLLTAGIYTWQSLAAWNAYEIRLTQEQAEYQRLKDTALNGSTSDERFTAIVKLDGKLQERGTLCMMNGLFAWQSAVLPVLNEGVTHCKAKVKQLDTVAGPLHALRSSLETSQRLQGVLSKLIPSEPFTDKNWAQHGLGAAKQAQESLNDIKASGETKELIETANGLTSGLVKSWESLISANEAKDKAAFLAASAEVVKAYASFAGLADSFDELISTQAQKLIDSAKSL